MCGKKGKADEKKCGLPQVSRGATVILEALKGFRWDVSGKSPRLWKQGLKASRNCAKLASKLNCSVENSLVDKDMTLKRKEVGAIGEKLAADLLKKRGYKIIQRNFRCREGEIDIIAQKGECLVFVEVRTKKNTAFGTPEESVTLSKREKLISLANAYLQAYDKPPLSWRIDVVAVELTPDNRVSRLEHIENAVS